MKGVQRRGDVERGGPLGNPGVGPRPWPRHETKVAARQVRPLRPRKEARRPRRAVRIRRARGPCNTSRPGSRPSRRRRPAVDEAMAVEEGKAENLRVHPPRQPPDARRRGPPPGSHKSWTPGRQPRPSGPGPQRARLETRRVADPPGPPASPARVMVNRIWARALRRRPSSGRRTTSASWGEPARLTPRLLDYLAGRVSSGPAGRVKADAPVDRHLDGVPHEFAARPWGRGHGPGRTTCTRTSNRRRLERGGGSATGMLAVAGPARPVPRAATLLKANPAASTSTAPGSRRYDAYGHPRGGRSTCRSSAAGWYDVLQTLDFPDPSVPNGRRGTSTIPTQALLMLNSPLADRAAEALAAGGPRRRRWRPPPASARAYRPGARPAADHLRGRDGADVPEEVGGPPPTPARRRLLAWRGFCRVLLASNDLRLRGVEPMAPSRRGTAAIDRAGASGLPLALHDPVAGGGPGSARPRPASPRKPPHFPARAKAGDLPVHARRARPQVDTFDHKPLLDRDDGKPLPFPKPRVWCPGPPATCSSRRSRSSRHGPGAGRGSPSCSRSSPRRWDGPVLH